MIDSELLDDIAAEAARVGLGAVKAGLHLRLMGGVAVYVMSPSVRRPPYARAYRDFDLAVEREDARSATAFLEAAGYVPERMFNALHGAGRLNFAHPGGRWTVDVIVDELRMSHRIDLRGRLAGPSPTLTLADLLLTKLQIWEMNSKDVGDIVCLLADHEIADREDPGTIDRRRLVNLAADDWGLCHTIERNLREAVTVASEAKPDGAPLDPVRAAEALIGDLDGAPKTIRWRARARVGERVRWYETPEEVRH
jgi:hypothetical protein